MNLHDFYNSINQRTKRDYPQLALHEVIDQQCSKTPEAIAVRFENQTQTYSELHQKSNDLATYLIAQGIGPGDFVGLSCDRNIDMPALVVGIIKSGAGYVPLDPDYPAERLAYMVENSEVKHIIALSLIHI